MNNSVKLSAQAYPTYKDIFGQKEPEEYADLFKDIPTNVVIEIISGFMAQIHGDEQNKDLQEHIVKKWIARAPIVVQNHILSILSVFNYNFFNNVSSLFFIENALVNFHPHQEIADLTPDQEYRLFLAYLKSTQEWVDKQRQAMKVKKIDQIEDFIKLILPFYLPFHEFQESKIYWIELAKAIYFFQFVEQDRKLGLHLDDFLSEQKVKSWKEYLFRLMSIYILPFEDNKKSVLVVDQEDKDTIDFLENLSLNLNAFTKDQDFLFLRQKPIYKLREGHYAIYNFNFLIDKVFQSIQFDFAALLKKKGVIRGLDEFKTSHYSEEFAEKYFLNSTIPYLIGKRDKVIALSGDDLAQKLGDKGPDYYVRCGTKLFIVELKDILMPAKVKWSHDYDTIKDELLKKLKTNQKGKPKGISQLSNFISTYKKGGFKFDHHNNLESNIYPLLICTDNSFNAFGINKMLSTEFQILMENNGISAKIVEPILIHIDTIIQFQDLIHDKKIPFHLILNDYIKFINRARLNNELPLHLFTSFKDFLPTYLHDKGIELNNIPRDMKRVISEIIDENHEYTVGQS